MAYRRFADGIVMMDEAWAALNERGLTWRGVQVLREIRTLDLYFQPMITVGLKKDRTSAQAPADVDDDAAAQLVALLFVPHADPDDTEGPACFDDVACAALLWALDTLKSAVLETAGTPPADARVTRSQLEFISKDLDSGQPIDFCTIIDFLRENFRFRIRPMPADAAVQDQLRTRGLTLFPMPPYLSVKTSDRLHKVDFQTFNPCTAAYRKVVDEYYRELDVHTHEPDEQEAHMPADETADGPDSLAALIFGDYFLIIVRQIVQAALDTFEGFEYRAAAGDTLKSIATCFGIDDEDVVDRLATANQDNEAFFDHAEDGTPNELRFEKPARAGAGR